MLDKLRTEAARLSVWPLFSCIKVKAYAFIWSESFSMHLHGLWCTNSCIWRLESENVVPAEQCSGCTQECNRPREKQKMNKETRDLAPEAKVLRCCEHHARREVVALPWGVVVAHFLSGGGTSVGGVGLWSSFGGGPAGGGTHGGVKQRSRQA